MVEGMIVVVNVMLSLMSVLSPLPALCDLSVCTVVRLCTFGVFALGMSLVPTTPACTWWNRPEEDLSSGKSESTHPSRTVVKSIEVFYGVESVVRGNADSLLN